jgi:hypothetical protein
VKLSPFCVLYTTVMNICSPIRLLFRPAVDGVWLDSANAR